MSGRLNSEEIFMSIACVILMLLLVMLMIFSLSGCARCGKHTFYGFGKKIERYDNEGRLIEMQIESDHPAKGIIDIFKRED